MLDLLGIEHAVVALTKVDRVDAELAELAELEIEERLAGTGLEGSPVVPVSAVAGIGLDELRVALSQALTTAGGEATGRPRLWIDRAFTIAGAGTVVTGTLVGGDLTVGEQVELHPGRISGRIRSLQSHEADRQVAVAGTRVAANIAGLERQEVQRGAMVGRPGDWEASNRPLVAVRRARYVDEELTDRGAYHLHLGSGAWPARLRALGRDADGGEVAILTLDEPIPLQMGDRFVLREVGRRSIVAGGRVLEPRAPRKGEEARAAAPALRRALDTTADAMATALLERRGVEHGGVLAAHAGGGHAAGALMAGPLVMAPDRARSLRQEAVGLTRAFHAANPLRPGIPRASLASQLDLSLEALAAVLGTGDELEERGSAVASHEFQPTLDAEREDDWSRIEEALITAGLSVPRVSELGIDRELLHVLLREERLVRVASDLVYLPGQLDDLVGRLQALPDPFTVAEFRDALGVTRKYAVPLLEWLDAKRVTVRNGDVRTVVGS